MKADLALLVLVFVAGFATGTCMLATRRAIRRERDRDKRDDRAVLGMVALNPGSTIIALADFAELSTTQVSYALARLMRTGMVKVEGGHVPEAAVYFALPAARFVLASIPGFKL
jgi:hypothetical protein